VAFGMDATWITSPESSDYNVLDDDSNVAVINVDSDDDKMSEEEVETSVDAVQHLYSVFLPPQLCLECLEDNAQEKHRKVANRWPVYTGTSRMMLWQKNATCKDAAQSCATLDMFVVRKVWT